MGGQIAVESTARIGTTFRFTLALPITDAARLADHAPYAETKTSGGRRNHVCYISFKCSRYPRRRRHPMTETSRKMQSPAAEFRFLRLKRPWRGTALMAVACWVSVAADVHAQEYPAGPIHILSSTFPGGVIDLLARPLPRSFRSAAGKPLSLKTPRSRRVR